MVDWPIRLQWYELYMLRIPDIHHSGSLPFPEITIVAKREATAIIMPLIMPYIIAIKARTAI